MAKNQYKLHSLHSLRNGYFFLFAFPNVPVFEVDELYSLNTKVLTIPKMSSTEMIISDSSIPFGFEGRIWDLIVSVPDHCLSFYFSTYTVKILKIWTSEILL